MSDPKNESTGATPPEDAPAGEAQQTPAGEAQQPAAGSAAADQMQGTSARAADASEAQTQATQAADAAPAQEQAAASSAEQPTAVLPPAHAAAATAGPRAPWYRRRWAVITGSVAAGVILFLGGMAVGSTFDGNDRGDFDRGDFHGQMGPDGGQGYGQQGWGDNSGAQGMLPPMGQGGQGHGPGFDRDGDRWHQDGRDYDQPQQAPSAAPSVTPSTAPQAYYQ